MGWVPNNPPPGAMPPMPPAPVRTPLGWGPHATPRGTRGLCYGCNRPGHYVTVFPFTLAHMNVAIPFAAPQHPYSMYYGGNWVQGTRDNLRQWGTYFGRTSPVSTLFKYFPVTRRTTAAVGLCSTHISSPRSLHKKARLDETIVFG